MQPNDDNGRLPTAERPFRVLILAGSDRRQYNWTDAFAAFVARKGKVEPGRYRAYGYEPPKHRWADVKLAWREARMRLGIPPAGSSPAVQKEMGLNRDTTLRPKQGEGVKVRDE